MRVSEPGESRQIIGRPGRGRYELVSPPAVEPGVCRFCGADIVQIAERWYALEGRWPNLAHCHYSARNGESVGHEPERLNDESRPVERPSHGYA